MPAPMRRLSRSTRASGDSRGRLRRYFEIFQFEVAERGGGAHRLPGRASEQLLDRDLGSQAMHVVVQPAEEPAELSGGDLFLDLRALCVQRIPELRRDEGAERVRREVAERADR